MSSVPPPAYGYAPPPRRRRPFLLPLLLGLAAVWIAFTLMQHAPGGARVAPAPDRLKAAAADSRPVTALGDLAED